MYLNAIGFLFLCSLSLIGCDSGPGDTDDVMKFDREDSEMVAAQQKARDNIEEFLTALKNPEPEQDRIVKMRFVEGDDTEVMWISDVRLVDGKLVGSLDNDPRFLKNVKKGDQASVAPGEISDWAILEEGEEPRGGYTIRVMLKRQAEAKEEGD